MKLATVIGTVVAAAQHRDFDGQTLLLCEPIEPQGAVTGPAFIAVDRANAGVGDRVLVNQEGNGARQIFGVGARGRLAIQSIIVGVVDAVTEAGAGA